MGNIQIDLGGLGGGSGGPLSIVEFVVPVDGSEEYVYTVGDEDVLLLDSSNNFLVVNLPLASESTGRKITVGKTDPSYNYIGLRSTPIDGNELNSDLIGGGFPYMLYKKNQTVTILSDGIGWQIISEA